MQNRAIFLRTPLSVLASLALFLATFSMAFADETLELPKKISDLRAPVSDVSAPKESAGQDFSAAKSSLKLEIINELRGDKNFTWQQSAKPKLNFLELTGYLRARGNLLNRCDLGTYIPSLERGTSQCAPPVSYFNVPATSDAITSAGLLFSSDLRFRIEPTLNVSEDIRIRGRFDLLDNLVFGSTSTYMTGTNQPNPSYPIAALSQSQNSPMPGVNSHFGPLAIKQLWGEVSFPYGEFRFGRLPLSFGLGILYGSGNDITHDFGNNVDGVFFETRLGGFQLMPGFTVSYTGPTGRGGGLGINGGDRNNRWFAAEGSQQYDLDPSDNVYNLHLSLARKDSSVDIQRLLDDNRNIWNYGVMGTYRFQINDSSYSSLSNATPALLRAAQTKRDAHLGLLSLWSKLQSGALHIEGEAAGIFGIIGNGTGLWNDPTRAESIWVYQGGVALESRYGFIQDRLQIGLDAGWASGDSAPGFGIRPGNNKTPANGAADGQQFDGTDNAITNFAFDRDYHVDMMLFREVLGTVSDAFYAKPHIAYYFTESLGVRGDVIGSMTNFARTTTGNNNFLGIELDASAFFKTADGFVFNLQYGHLFPFSGLNHDSTTVGAFIEARSASALRLFAGIEF